MQWISWLFVAVSVYFTDATHNGFNGCCDVCEQLVNPESSFSKVCGSEFNPRLLIKAVRDCYKAAFRGDTQDLADFLSATKRECYDKTQKVVIFECPEPSCDGVQCDLCAKIPGTPCGESLHLLFLSRHLHDCYHAQITGGEEFETFWTEFEQSCQRVDKEFTRPSCDDDCNECALVPSTECGYSLHPVILAKTFQDCYRLQEAGGYNFDNFWQRLADICEAKDKEYEKPSCPAELVPCEEVEPDPQCVGECDICSELGDPTSQFSQVCGLLTPDPMDVIILVQTCNFLKGDEAIFATFINAIANSCIMQTGNFFEYCPFVPPTNGT